MPSKFFLPLVVVPFLAMSSPVIATAPPELALKASSSIWQRFSPPEGDFSILFPGVPEEKQETIDGEAGQMLMRGFRVIRENEAVYTVLYFDFPSGYSVNSLEAKAILNVIPQNLADKSKFRLISQKNITLNGFPGKEMRLEGSGKNIARVRSYVVNNRLYMLFATTNKERYLRRSLQGFLTSFKLNTTKTQPAAPPPDLNAQLKQAVCGQNWQAAIKIVDRMLANSSIPAEERQQLTAYRQRLEGLARSRSTIPPTALTDCTASNNNQR